jgi:class 3 adenylate cyclase/tetratricopeptide (TPR) repeat protein
MKCSSCGFENPDGLKFCGECGSKIEVKCTECGFCNPYGFKFCGECGHDLLSIVDTSLVDYTQPESYTPRFLADKILTTRSSIEGERKLVTVFFADVTGYTSLSEKLDPEEVHQIMDGAFKILMDEIHRFEGTINQFTGDGVMALFGAPLAHEDHAQRACHAALSVQKALDEYGDKIKADTDLEFKMRIGLNSGHVIVGSIGDDLRMDYTAVGDTTNLADRMQGLANPGSVMVSANTHKLASNYFEFESLGKVEIKGKEEKQEAYELIKTGEVVSRIGASVSKGLTRFVGRKISMAALNEPYDRVVEGSGQVVGIVGEAGVGKSRLLLEFINQLPPDGFTYLEGRCLHYGGSMAYLPVIDILKSYFEIKDGDREYLIKKKVEEKVLDLDLNLEQTLPSFQEILSLKVDDESYLKQDAQMKKILTFEALRDLFIRISQIQPLVIAIEDLHWIDKISEDFIDYLIGWLANSKICLLLLYRPEYTHQWGSKSYYSKIGLDQLSLDFAKELVKAMLEGGEVAPELRELILSRSAGNPLFMEEFTQTLIENGSIKKEQNQFVLDGDIKDIKVPDTIQGIISARMDRLEDNLKRTMQVASVIGRDFAFRILQSITGMQEDLKSYLLNLQGLEFIYEKQLFPELEYIFKHALIQEVAYNSLLQSRRREIHQKIAEAIEQLYSDRIEEFYEMLAYHYSASDNLEKAIHYLELSAEKASGRYAFGESIQLLEQALEFQNHLNPQGDVKGCDLLIALGYSLINAAKSRRVLDREAHAAWSIAQELGDKERSFNTCKLALDALMNYGLGPAVASPEGRNWVEKADQLGMQGTKERALIDVFKGTLNVVIGNSHKGVSQLTSALEQARKLGDIKIYWFAAWSWLYWVCAPQHSKSRLFLAEELLSKSHVGLNPTEIMWGLMMMIDAFLCFGMRHRVDTLMQKYREITRLSRLDMVVFYTLWEGVIALMDGLLEKAVSKIRYCLEVAKSAQITEETRVFFYGAGVRVFWYLGDEVTLSEVSNYLIGSDSAPGDSDYFLKVQSPPHFGRTEEAKENWRKINRNNPVRSAKDLVENPARNSIFHLEFCTLSGFKDPIEWILNRFTDTMLKTTGGHLTTCCSRHLGAGSALLERYEEAKEHYHEAIRVCTEMPFRPELALSRFQLAELQFEHFPEERPEALEHLEFAITEFEEMKMKPSLENALGLKSKVLS